MPVDRLRCGPHDCTGSTDRRSGWQMRVWLMVGGVAAATALVVGAAGCGNKSSSTSSSSTSSTSKTTASSTAAAQPTDFTQLLIKASDIQAPGDTFTMQQPQL